MAQGQVATLSTTPSVAHWHLGSWPPGSAPPQAHRYHGVGLHQLQPAWLLCTIPVRLLVVVSSGCSSTAPASRKSIHKALARLACVHSFVTQITISAPGPLQVCNNSAKSRLVHVMANVKTDIAAPQARFGSTTLNSRCRRPAKTQLKLHDVLGNQDTPCSSAASNGYVRGCLR